MTTLRTFLLALLATGAASGLAAGSASAETICVHAPAGTACDGEQADLANALQAAQGTFEPTTIALGASQTGPFVYPDGPVIAGNTVTIKGVGAARPALTGPAGSTVLNTSEVSLDRVDVLAGLAPGIGIDAAFGELHDVHVKGGAVGIRAHEGMTLDGVSVAGSEIGVSVQDGETVSLARSSISATDTGVLTRGHLTATSTLIETTAAGGRGLVGGDSTVALDHVTAVHRGPLDGHEIGLSFHPVDNGGRADLSSVVVAGYSHEIERDPSEGPSNLPMTIRDSVWDDANDLFVDVPNTGQVLQSGNVHADPGLVDLAGGDYRLRGGSPAVDRDSQTDPRYVDIDGLAPVGAAADAGAFEFRGDPPAVDPVDAPAPDPAPTPAATPSGPAKDLVAPRLTKVRLSKNHRKVLFTVSERAKIRVTVRGRTIVKTVAAGRRSIRLGRVRHGVVKITATDLAGNRSAARRVRS